MLHSPRKILLTRSIWILLIVITHCIVADNIKNPLDIDLEKYRQRVVHMFQHAYDSYLKYAYPFDELRPLSCDGQDTWGSYSLTLIDALDTLIVMGNKTEFRRIAGMLIDKAEDFFDMDINASVFETNIRVVGGLVSAHLLSHRADMVLEPGWPCSGPLLRMAEVIARKLLPAFDTPTGMPYGTVNLQRGVPRGETTVTCTAGVGTFIIEFGTLSRLTGDPIFEKVAMRAMRSLWEHRSPIGLVGNHVDVSDGKWTAMDSGVGGGIDSYYEYLVKGSIMFQIPELLEMFKEYEAVLEKYTKRDDWYMWANMKKGGITLPFFTSLDCYWPGVQSMLGNVEKAMKTLHNYHQVWKQFGFTPEYYNIPKSEVHHGREGYPLRPELIESAVYLYQATRDPYLLEIGIDILEAIEHSARTPCGYATVKDVRYHRLEDRMESFFLAETTKYLYLLFDPDNFIHNKGGDGKLIKTPSGDCVIDSGGYVFTTEAHPIDMAAVHCCSAQKKAEDADLQDFHNNLNLLELLDITDSKGSLISGKKLKKRLKRRPKTSTDAEQSLQFVIEQTAGSDFVELSKPDGNMENKKGSGNVEKNQENGRIVEENNLNKDLDTVAALVTGSGDIKVKVTYKAGQSDTTPIEAVRDTNTSDTSSDSTVIEGDLDDFNDKKRKIEERRHRLEKKRQSLQLAEKLLALFSGLTGGENVQNVTQYPNINHLYEEMKHYDINYVFMPERMKCPTQPFHMRMSAMGEMFEEN